MIKNAASAAAPAASAIGATRATASGVSWRHPFPLRSFASHRKVSSSGSSMGATAIFVAIASPTIIPSSKASRHRRVSISRSIAHSAPREASTVKGSGR